MFYICIDFEEQYHSAVLSKFDCVICQSRAYHKTKNLFYKFVGGGEHGSIGLQRSSLPARSLWSTFSHLFPALSNPSLFSLIFRLFCSLQLFDLVSLIYTFQHLDSLRLYLTPSFLLHYIVLPRSHQSVHAVRTSSRKTWIFTVHMYELFIRLSRREGSRKFGAHVLHRTCALG